MTEQNATAPGDHTMLFVFDYKFINNVRIWLKFTRLIKIRIVLYSLKILYM